MPGQRSPTTRTKRPTLGLGSATGSDFSTQITDSRSPWTHALTDWALSKLTITGTMRHERRRQSLSLAFHCEKCQPRGAKHARVLPSLVCQAGRVSSGRRQWCQRPVTECRWGVTGVTSVCRLFFPFFFLFIIPVILFYYLLALLRV